MELYLDYDFFAVYVDSIGLDVQIPTWLAIGIPLFIYSIRLIRKDK